MNILEKLSSKAGDRTEESNKAVAAECLKQPDLLEDIESGLLSDDAKLAADCAEVMTNVAMENPRLIVPFAKTLFETMNHKNSKTKWEAVHSVSLIAEFIPSAVANNLSLISNLMFGDKSVIVRDYSTDIIANFAGVGKDEAEKAFPLLRKMLYEYEGKHAGHALKGLMNVVCKLPEEKNVIAEISEEFIGHKRGVISKAAKSLAKFIQTSC
ncbi:MAG TPA: hypothetical protein PK624_08990 [Spirochaetota bacterium]|mgnify:CR=1 FL=1|nr:hypothetical protein [Spirochaetota bacterium]HOR44917.1 hypothetical protein [Spirochaetota bacterium]HPK56472.1 hypothetical protein [Spirochaetota bacterium]